jgi:hypothetical protein
MFKQQLNITIFIIIQLINMDIGLREYPVERWVTASPDFPISLIVSDLNRCSLTQSMQPDDHSAYRWRRGSSRSLVRSRSSCTRASSRVKTLPKNLIARLSWARSQQHDGVPEALLSPVPCAWCRRWGCEEKAAKWRERGRGLLNKNTLLCELATWAGGGGRLI